MPEIVRSYRQTVIAAPGSAVPTVLVGAVIIAALYFAREVLIPIALAILMSFALAPVIRGLRRWHISRSLSVITVVLISFAGIFGLGSLMVSQVNQLASDLPRYESTLREKIRSLRGATASSETLDRAATVLQDLGKELEKPKPAEGTRSPLADRSTTEKPIPVEIRQPNPGALQALVLLIAPLIVPLTTTGIVLIFVIFILLQREDLRNRLIRLAGVRDIQRTTAAIDDAGRRLGRLFLMQLALNAAFGVVIGAGLWFIGVPSAPLWGILAMILRFVPYIGAVLAAIFPLALAAAVGPDWTMVIWTALLFAIIEPLTGHVIEPLVTGHSSGLSPVAVVVSATFWTWLWGPVGLVLATPLTVCLAVLGRHVDQLKFLDVMFGDEPVLTPAELVYQRMLAGDTIEAAEQAQIYLKDRPLAAYYEDVLVEGLKLAQADANREDLDQERMLRIRDAVAEIVDDLSEHKETVTPSEPNEDVGNLTLLEEAEAADGLALPSLSEEWRGEQAVLCVPGHGALDEALALIIAHLVRRRGLGARAEQADALSMSRIFALDTKGVALVCLCYLQTATPAQIRYSVRRLRRKLPDASILVARLGKEDREGQEEFQASLSNTMFVSQSLKAAIDTIVVASRQSGNVLGFPRKAS